MLFIDIFEPVEIEDMLKPSLNVVRASLNSDGKADYFWCDVANNTRQWERKQLGEALADLDSVEEQLNRQLSSCDEQTLVIEGLGLPTLDGFQLYELTKDRRFWRPITYKGEVPSYLRRKSLDRFYEAWKWGLRSAGVLVVETTCLEMTARAIAGAYAASMKPEHTTLRRYLQPHIPPFSPDSHVDNLARLKDCGIGIERAQRLIQELGTFHAVVTAPRHKLHSILGVAVTKRFLSTIGRVE